MAKYIKREMADLRGTGQTKSYYQMKTYGRLDYDEFLERCTRHGGLSRSILMGAIAAVEHELSLQIANGYSVKIDGLGTFGARIGVRPDKEQDDFEPDTEKRNARSVCVKGLTFRADRQIVSATDEHCTRLERAGESRLLRSALTEDERLSLALDFMRRNAFMRVSDYAMLTGLSRSVASTELRRLAADQASGISAKGRSSAKVYVLS